MSHFLNRWQRQDVGSSQDSRFYGLRNQGATSNLNSVLQVLFMTRDFREAVNRSPADCRDCIDQQLNTLFENLKKHKTETVEITKKLGIGRVDEQRDAAEYLEKILTLTSDEASQIFKGQLTHRTVCDCGAVSDEENPFWNLPLPLSNSSVETYSVVDGIQEFFKDSRFHGDDQLYCEKCDAKRDATVSCVLQQHPEVLMLLLKRFEFSYRHMTYIKNDHLVEVPLTVTIPENHKYELYALVNHYGSLRSGHYTATIRSEDDHDRWYDFSDSSVTELCNQPFSRDEVEKSHSAYLLFYRRSKKDTKTQENRDVSIHHDPPLDKNYGAEAEDQCKQENMRELCQVLLHGLRGEKIHIDLCNTEEDMQNVTVKHLKDKISEIYPEVRDDKNLQLTFIDKILEGDATLLSKYGVTHSSDILMVYNVHGAEGPLVKEDKMGVREGETWSMDDAPDF